MATTNTLGMGLAENISKNNDTVDETPDDNLFAGAGTLTSIQVIASGTSGTAQNYYRLSLSDSAITLAVDEEDIKFPLREGKTVTVHITDVGANSPGIAFTFLSEWCTGGGGPNADQAPSSSVSSYLTAK